MVVLDVVGLNELSLVIHLVAADEVVAGVSVTLTVDVASTSSGLTAEGTVGPDRVLDGSGVADVTTASGRAGSSGVGGALDEVVYLLPEVALEAVLVGIFTAWCVCGGVDDVVTS